MKLINDKRLLCAKGNKAIYYKHGKIYFEEAGAIRFITPMYNSKVKSLCAKCSWIERALRLEPKLAVCSENECILSHHGFAYYCDWDKYTVKKEHAYRKSMNNPVQLCVVKGVQGFNDGILYGEYWGNTEGEAVNIFQRVEGQWKIVYTFPAGSITHVHGFVCDRDRSRILILTGDFDKGSGIWEAKQNFSQVQPLLLGSQQYRCCVAFTNPQGIIYATDTPLEQNAVYFLNEENGRLRKLYNIPGPCIYGRSYIDARGHMQYVFATSVEPDSRITGWRYLLTYRLGVGVKNRRTHVIMGNWQDGFQELFSLKKDWLPMGLFQFGNVQFPDTEELVCVPQAVYKYGGRTIQLFE